jgi:NADH-quinone oxidoreductase subunit J
MLTRARIGVETDLNNKNWFMGVPVAVLLFATLVIALNDGFGDQRLPSDAPVVSTQQLSDQIFGPYLLPFWALSFVLLAAVIGAIVLSRRD